MRLDPLQVKAAVGDHRAMVIHRAVMARRHVVVVDLSALTPTAGAVAAATENVSVVVAACTYCIYECNRTVSIKLACGSPAS